MSSTESDKTDSVIEAPQGSPMSPSTPSKELSLEAELKFAMEDFYKKYNPERISTLDFILESYKGKELELLSSLKEKYNVKEYKLFDDYVRRVKSQSLEKTVNSPDDNRRGAPSVSSPPPNRLSTAQQSTTSGQLLSSMNDMSKFLSGWGMNATTETAATPSTGITNGTKTFSSTDELLLTTRVNSLQSELATCEAEKHNLQVNFTKISNQVAALRKENTTLKNENSDLKNRHDVTAKGYGEVTSREVQLLKDIQMLNDQLKDTDGSSVELQAKIDIAEKQKINKHNQLQEAIQLNHRLDAQLKYFMIRSYNSYEKVSNVTNGEVTVNVNNTETNNEKPTMNFESMVSSLPNGQELLSVLSTLDVEPKELTEKSNEELIKEILACRQKSHVLESSFMASRLELLLEVKQRAAAEERIIEQQAEIERLQKKLSNVGTELETAFGSADTLKNQILDAVAEVNTYKNLIVTTDEQLNARNTEIKELRSELDELKNEVEVCSQARIDLAANCAAQMRSCETKANDYVKGMKESLQLEREDILSKLHYITLQSNDLKIAVSSEAQKETQKLRDELFKARRNETQKEREIAFLQRQLVEAAKKIAQVNVEKDQLIAAAATTTATTPASVNSSLNGRSNSGAGANTHHFDDNEV